MSEFFASLSETFGSPSDYADEQPVRAELFSVERLEQYAHALAAEQKTVLKKGRAQLLPRLEDNGRKLIAAYRMLVEAIQNGRAISPAAEWLIDNFHIVEEQLREIREDLPKSYYHELPKLAGGQLKDYPRIYAVALALIAHTDCRLDTNTLRRFIAAYQTVAPLSIGELWAVAITLRLALVENLRRLAVVIWRAREEREQADKLADRLLETASRRPEALVGMVTERFGKRDKIPRSLVVQLTQRLREQDPSVMPVTDWLEGQLARQGTSIEQVVHYEHQRQAAMQVTVGNVITSMRLLSTLDWRDFFESVSLIEPLLAADPAGAYEHMEFATRDRYRHVIERVSKRTRADELEIARTAVELAREAQTKSQSPENKSETAAAGYLDQPRETHVGYYLVDDGLKQLESSFAYRPRPIERFRRFVLSHATAVYLGSIGVLTILFIALLLFALDASARFPLRGSAPGWLLIVATILLGLIPALDLALSILNWDVTHMFPPRLVPRIDTSTGIPEAACTMVVVPTLFSDETQVKALAERLEVHFLANQDPNVFFALLGDFADADSEVLPDDDSILEVARTEIAALNARHSSESAPRFHFFLRRRQWNEGEQRWLGWERKRGKLEEFNRLLRGASDTSFVVQTADDSLLQRVHYVITLDTDTQLPRDVARKLVGAAIHPLNRPKLDPATNMVTHGYGIVQPRVSISLVSAARSRFARIFSGNTGIDPYTTAVSDVYQDLFCEGSFTGKGLYDVDAFQTALSNRVPEQSLLSHDLFESLFARAALATDIELLDDYPASYEAYAKRQHRWTRGDWQIARWLLPTVPNAERSPTPNPLSPISRWKIFDNLRRSLVAPAMFLWLLAAWTFLPGSALLWSLFVVITIAFPVYLHVTTSLLIHPRGVPWTSHFWTVWGDVTTNTAQFGLSLLFLPHQAYLMTDAIVRTLYRKLVSRRKLLQWVTAADAERNARGDLFAFYRLMLPAVLLALTALALSLIFKPQALAVVAVFAVAWLLSPIVAQKISVIRPPQPKLLSVADVDFSRFVCRRTWRFFEAFVGTEDNWLPPDNFQEDPSPVIAHRTSPTNIGMLLLATVSAHDLGYVASAELVERFELTFNTLAKLKRFRGHFLNWYDTRTLEPLQPEYISTVDSGNLAGHAIAVKQACVELPDTKLFDQRTIKGLADTVNALSLEVDRLGTFRQRTSVVTVSQLRNEVDACQRILLSADLESLPSWFLLFETLSDRAAEIEDITSALAHEHGEANFNELRWWLGALQHQVSASRRDAETLAPWGRLFAELQMVNSRELTDNDEPTDALAGLLNNVWTFAELPDVCDNALIQLSAVHGEIRRTEATFSKLTAALEQGAVAAGDFLSRLSRIAQTCDQMIEQMDFKFLLDAERKVFMIGYNVTAQRADNSYYDLLASEARLASFVAIAKGDVPQEHWFRMGRQLTSVNGGRALISWTGTMFEYLMPLLVMRDYPNTLLNESYRAVVNRQIEYGEERRVPWGISESAFNVRDLHLNYQYGPFGVPGLGLKRGLIEDLVVSPYATMLASEINPEAALKNLRRLERDGALGTYGYYEAIDYTRERVPQGQTRVLIRSFMTHHQGMSLVALNNALNEDCMERRFHADPLVQATELLLQERIPVGVPAAHPRAEEVMIGRVSQAPLGLVKRVYHNVDTDSPRTQLLSNGTYNVMITAAGGGYSNCGPNAVTRWREDVTRDNWGTFIYLRDVRSGAVWSAGHQPVQKRPQSYEVAFSEDKADFWRSDAGIVTHLEVVVSGEDNAEVRRVSLTNNSTRTREIELTSYAEVVLNTQQADVAHPAFSNLFIETEFFAAENAILAHRRQRSSDDLPVWGAHVVVVEGDFVGSVQYETDRGRFLGRGHTAADPIAVMEDRPLSNTTGAVLDPVFSLRRRVRIPPNQTVRCSFSTIVARSREEAMMLADKYHDPSTFERELRLAWTKAQVEMTHLNIDAEEAHLFQRLASRIIYSEPSLRPRPHVLALNTRAQSSLWAYGISGDLPILVARIDKAADLPTIRKMVRAHEYLHYKGLNIDLVILNDNPTTYLQNLQKELETMVRTSGLGMLQDKPGGVFLRRADQMPEADRILLHSVARAVIVCDRGNLDEQLERPEVSEVLPPAFVPRLPSQTYPEIAVARPDLDFFNGLGGFHQGGREYVTLLGAEQWTPAPWSNIIANHKEFGFQVTETGGGYTWSVNSRENRLTPWSNDAISDPPGEIVYLRDEDTGTVWSATPLPIRETEPYVIRHGQGYTVFEHISHGITQELLLFVPLDATVKISLLRLRNRSGRKRKLTVTMYNELVLGVQRPTSAPYVITEIDQPAATVFAHNPFNNEFANRVTFAAASEKLTGATCDRKEFLGRNGTHSSPAGLRRVGLSGRDGAGLDPCAALQVTIELAPHEGREIAFLLGEAPSKEEAQALVTKFKHTADVNNVFEDVLTYWDTILNTVEVKTPDPAMDTMLNRWLLYQTLACRIWARSAFYQSGGAFGFRDQLQDVMALVYSSPAIAREQIVLAAAHQFKEGDVQHWWHPPTSRGVRTRFSDDLLWLPFVATFYANVTGDRSVFDEVVPFLEQPVLLPEEHEVYRQPTVSAESASVFEHCLRALDRSLVVGQHGLPLMGGGDWNDGMNRVGHGGKGESVWVGWFLYTTLTAFTPFCDDRNDKAHSDRYRGHLEKLKQALADKGWDGDWYRRAYFDDGTPLGSVQNDECRIDSIVQSWAVISGAAEPYRAQRAMAAVEEYLIRRGDGLVILFTPPFDRGKLDPGYIKGYVPGVRENGGQYTHAALWTLIAFAILGDGERAGELFSLLNPVNHSSTRAGLHKYKVEPYVAVGDVYAVPPHTGRGGWTWYTGSAGWMYRAGLESILGFKLHGERLEIDPCVPRWWRNFEIRYRRGRTTYRITVENPAAVSRGVVSVEVDGKQSVNEQIALSDDGQTHEVRVVMGEKPAAAEEANPESIGALREQREQGGK